MHLRRQWLVAILAAVRLARKQFGYLFLPGDGHHLTVRLVGAVLGKQRQHDVAAVVLCVVFSRRRSQLHPNCRRPHLFFFAHSCRAVTIADSKVGSQALSWSGLPFSAFVNVSIKVFCDVPWLIVRATPRGRSAEARSSMRALCRAFSRQARSPAAPPPAASWPRRA